MNIDDSKLKEIEIALKTESNSRFEKSLREAGQDRIDIAALAAEIFEESRKFTVSYVNQALKALFDEED